MKDPNSPTVCITGSRFWYNPTELEEYIARAMTALEYRLIPEDGVNFVVGDCPTGVDKAAREILGKLHWCCDLQVYHADWKTYGKKAGPLRNEEMISKGMPNLVLAFPATGEANNGTRDCIARAITHGIRVFVTPVFL